MNGGVELVRNVEDTEEPFESLPFTRVVVDISAMDKAAFERSFNELLRNFFDHGDDEMAFNINISLFIL